MTGMQHFVKIYIMVKIENIVFSYI